MKLSRLKIQNKAVLKHLAVMLLCSITLTLGACTKAGDTKEEVSKQEETVVQAPEIEKKKFNYNPYLMVKEQREFIGEDYDRYKELLDAVIDGKTEVNMDLESQKQCDRISRGIFAGFFPKVFIDDFTYDVDSKKINITYKIPVGEYKIKVNDFIAKVEEILNDNLSEKDDDFTKALKLYKYVATHITYDDDPMHSSYKGIMEGVGLCQTYSSIYEFLLRQVGIECSEAGGPMINGTHHAWTIAKIDGINYHFNPTFESTNPLSNGQGVMYFAMSDEERYDTGALPNYISPTRDWFPNMERRVCPEARYSSFRNCNKWEIDDKDKKIKMYNNDKVVYEYDIMK